MEGLCLKCGEHVASPWNFCPRCGASIAHEVHGQVLPPEHEGAPVQGAFGGIVFGVLAVPILVIVGTLLCLTGLGAILGIPLIIGAVLSPLLFPLIGLGTIQGKCPWCGTKVSSITTHPQGFYCHACSKRIVIDHRTFIRAA